MLFYRLYTWDKSDSHWDNDSEEEITDNFASDFSSSHGVILQIIEYSTYIDSILPTTLNNIIATASFTIPYPNMIENILGNFMESMRVNAATESVADMVALYLTIRFV